MFPLFPDPTPEQRAERERIQREADLKKDNMLKAALPFLKEAQRNLREAAGLNCGGRSFEKSMRHLAIYIDLVETELLRVR